MAAQDTERPEAKILEQCFNATQPETAETDATTVETLLYHFYEIAQLRTQVPDQDEAASERRKQLSQTSSRVCGMLRDVVNKTGVSITDDRFQPILKQLIENGHASCLLQFSRRFTGCHGWPPAEESALARTLQQHALELLETDPNSVAMLQNSIHDYPVVDNDKILECCFEAQCYNLAITLASRFSFEQQKRLVNKFVEIKDDKRAWKAIHRLHLNPSHFPNLLQEQAQRFLKWIIRDDDALRDTLIDAVVYYVPQLKQYTIDTLLKKYGPNHHWTRKYVHKLGFQEQHPEVPAWNEEEEATKEADRPEGTVKLPDDVQVHFVDTLEIFHNAINTLMQAEYVGFDSEWAPIQWVWKELPSGKLIKYDTVALVQLATLQDVFLIDMHAFTSMEQLDEINAGFQKILSTEVLPSIVAFGIKGDFDQVKKSYPELTALRDCLDQMSDKQRERKFWDLHVHYDKFIKSVKPENECNSTPSLKNLVFEVYEKHMDKRVRLSDWTRRPLTTAQMEYASLDAWLLVDMVYIWKQSNEK